jgi:hypothetical protein
VTQTEAPPVDDAPDDDKPIPVDSPIKDPKPTVADRAAGEKRRPILPAWMKNRSEFLTAARWACGHYWHTVRYHTWRTPLYGLRVLRQAPRGSLRTIRGDWGWIRDREGAPLRAHAARQEDAEEYLKLRRYRDGRVAMRLTLSIAAGVIGTGAALALYLVGDAWMQAAAITAAVIGLGITGTPADKPLISPAVVKPQATKLTAPVVTRALGALNIARINAAIAKNNGELSYPNPIAIDGPGWLAELETPYGVTATDVIERRDRLASGLRRQLGCVWPERPDADSLPTGISANAVLRFCLKVMGWQENDMVLGTGSYKSGVQATMFSRKDLGIGYLSGEGDDPKIVRSFYVDNNDAKAVAQRARGYREDAGTLTGHALDPEFEPENTTPAYDLLADVLKVVPADEEKVWNERVAARLAALSPGIYGGWKGETVTLNLKPLSVTTKDVAGTTESGTRTTRRGIERADVVQAVAARNGKAA